ncbi:MAG: putative N,N-dimethylformamidase [Rhizobacter sp.]|nr:putative N,N-dimethylformamidase [Rhizobacter sp.]
MIETNAVLGYPDELSVRAGERITFHLSSRFAKVDAKAVLLRCVDADANGPGIKYVELESPMDGVHDVAWHEVPAGSCAVVPEDARLVPRAAWSIGGYVWATRLTDAPQTLLARWSDEAAAGYAIESSKAGVSLRIGSDRGPLVVSTSKPLLERYWYWVQATFDQASGDMTISHTRLAEGTVPAKTVTALATHQGGWKLDSQGPFTMAARPSTLSPLVHTGHFDGKLEAPRIATGIHSIEALQAVDAMPRPGVVDARLVAMWDFSIGIDGLDVVDRSANRLSGTLLQLPRRAVTGVRWTGAVHDWRLDPTQYGAIHFHTDDIYDCGWPAAVTLDVPSTWRSGIHALRLRPLDENGRRSHGRAPPDREVDLHSGQARSARGEQAVDAIEADASAAETFITFFVTPAAGALKAPLVVLAATMTYLAYANSALRLHSVHFEVLTEHLMVLTPDDVYLQEHPEIGQSTYDHHIDGSGRAFSSWRRPVMNMRPRSTLGNLAIDSHFTDWLEEKGIDYDLVTDVELHRQGAGALKGYRVLASLSHPEYYSEPMMNAVMAYQNDGGRHVALGANGFYWRCNFHPKAPAAVEVRRGMAGTRTWESRYGEVHLAGTGEPGGLWRHSGFAPQKLVGVGFDAMVYDHAGYYRFTPGSRDARVAFAVDGIGEDERIGDFGVRIGGAVGIEIDRLDHDLGTPLHAVMIATSHGLGPGALPTTEEFRTTVHGLEGDQNALVRADIVFFETPEGGAVFATGSISYVLSLTCNGYDNNVSRLTENVLRRFLDETPFEMPDV